MTQEEQFTEETLTTEETQEEPIDWLVRGPELEAQNVKLQNDLKSREGQRRSQAERDADIGGLKDEVSALRKVIATSVKNSGDDDLVAEITQYERKADETQATNAQRARFDKEEQRLLTTIQEGDGLLVSDEDAAKLQIMWQEAWAQSQRNGNYEAVVDLQIEAQRMVNAEERKRAKETLEQERKNSKKRVTQALEKAGVNDLDTGSSNAGGGEQRSNRERMARIIEANGGRITTS